MSRPAVKTAGDTGSGVSERVIVGRLERLLAGNRKPKALQVTAVVAAPAPTRAALELALGYAIERMILVGKARDQADVARQLRLSRARVSQLIDLTLLDPDVQECVLLSNTQGQGDRRLPARSESH